MGNKKYTFVFVLLLAFGLSYKQSHAGDRLTQETLSEGGISLDEDSQIANFLLCIGQCTINGNGHTLTLADRAQIIVGTNTTLTLENVTIEGCKTLYIEEADPGNHIAPNIRCVDNTGQITLRNVTLVLQENYSLEQVHFTDDVQIKRSQTCPTEVVFFF